MAFIYTYSVNREGGSHSQYTHWTWAGIAFKPQYGLETGTKIFPMTFISTEAKAAHFSLYWIWIFATANYYLELSKVLSLLCSLHRKSSSERHPSCWYLNYRFLTVSINLFQSLHWNTEFIGVPNKVVTDGKRSTPPLSTSCNTIEILQVSSYMYLFSRTIDVRILTYYCITLCYVLQCNSGDWTLKEKYYL